MSFFMNCEVISHPEATITWRKDGRNFNGDSSRVVVTKTTIRFRNLVAADSGSYECHAQNAIGYERKSMSLVVEPGKCCLFRVCNRASQRILLQYLSIRLAILRIQSLCVTTLIDNGSHYKYEIVYSRPFNRSVKFSLK